MRMRDGFHFEKTISPVDGYSVARVERPLREKDLAAMPRYA